MANASGSAVITVTVTDGGLDNTLATPGDNGTAVRTFTVTVTAVNDAPSFTVGANQTVLEDAGPQTVTPFATSISPGPGESDAVTFVITNNSNPGLFATAPGISVTGTLTYTSAANQHGVATITVQLTDNGGTANGGVNQSATQQFTITVTPVNDAPVAAAKALTAQANLLIGYTINLAANGSGDVTDVDNADAGFTTQAFTLTSVAALSCTGCVATITSGSLGTFTFEPPPGQTGTFTLTYRVTDNGNPLPGVQSVPGAATGQPGVITITVSGPVVWFVDSTAPAGGNGTWTGTNSKAFQTLAQADAANVVLNDRVFVLNNSLSPISYADADGFTMPAGERLIGQGVTGASFDTVVLGVIPPAGSAARPAINGIRPVVSNTVTLADGATVTGINFAPSGAFAAMSGSGLATASAITIDQVNVTGGTSALSLTNVANSVTVTNATFTNTSGAEVLINGGTGNVSIAAPISSNAGRSIDIQNRTGGTVSFTGAITDTGQGIFLNTNTGSTINFTGGLSLSTTTFPAFTATGGGTVSNSSSVVNTIATTTGTALNVANTTIGASGLTFRSISASGAVNGIILNNTGATAGLTVTGNAGTCTSAATCTGGAIQNTTGDGLALTSTRNVSLTRLFVGTAANHGINANAVNGLTLSASRIQDSGNGDNEHGLNLVNAAGTVTIDATTFSGASEDLIHLENNNTNVTFTVTNSSVFTYPASVGAFANSAMLLLPGGTASVTASIQNSTFTNVRNAAVQIGANLLNSNGTQNLTFSNNTLNVTLAGRASGVVVSGQELTTTNITIANNNFSGAGGNGVISIDTNDTSRVQGTVSGNQITNPPGIGMFVAVDEAATNDIVFDNNTITNSGGDGIQAVNFGGVGVSTMQLALTNNVINGHSANTAVNFVGGISFSGFEDTSCVVLRGNSVTGTPPSPTQCGGAPCVDHYLEEVGGVLTLEEVPNTAATTANAAYINSINDPGPVTVFGTIDLTNGATCNVALMADGFARRASRRPSAVDEGRLAKLVLHAAKRLRTESATATATGPEDAPAPAFGLQLTDLAPGQLGRVAGGHISLDRDAAGWGWFIDPTPDEDEEFEPASPETGERRAKPGGPADGKMDLLTALMHEMSHARGEIDLDSVAHPGELMAARLKVGVRRRPPPVAGRRNDGGTIFE